MFIVNTWSQLTELSREHALVKSACLYLQTVLCLLVRDLHESLHLSDSVIPWWSEFLTGGITEQLRNCLGWERITKSISKRPWRLTKICTKLLPLPDNANFQFSTKWNLHPLQGCTHSLTKQVETSCMFFFCIGPLQKDKTHSWSQKQQLGYVSFKKTWHNSAKTEPSFRKLNSPPTKLGMLLPLTSRLRSYVHKPLPVNTRRLESSYTCSR